MGQGDNDDHGDENGANASDVAWIAAWTVGHVHESQRVLQVTYWVARSGLPLGGVSVSPGRRTRRSVQELTETQIHDQCLCFFSARLRAFRKHLELLRQAKRNQYTEPVKRGRGTDLGFGFLVSFNFILHRFNFISMGLETCEGCSMWARNPHTNAPRRSLEIGPLWAWRRVRGAAFGPGTPIRTPPGGA